MITDSLIANCKTDVEKIKKIYYWVQDKISYVAYEDGLGGFVPREADIIMKRRFGDCKDMASILTAMGKAAGLPIYLTWIGTTDIPYQFTEVPAPMAANHMIAAYVTKDTCLFLDATGKFQDLGVHTSFIQGKEAIIGISENEYIIKKVPYIPHTKTYVMDSVSLKIQDNLLVGNGYLKFDGYKKVHIQTQINGKSYTELYDYFKSYCEKGNNKFKLDTVIISKNERDVPVEIKYTFKIPNYITTLTNEIFMNLNFDKNYFEDFSTQDRKNGFEFLYAFDKQLLVTLALDKKYSVNFIPENSFYTNSNFGCQSSYTKTPSQLIFKSTIHINSTFVNYNEFEKWNEFLKEHNKNNNKSISLNKLQ